jgi:acetylornithine deacetylase/succinyl-diaminopimelate desuccinylase-like protein
MLTSISVSDAGWLAEAGVPSVICSPSCLEEVHSINEETGIAQILGAARLFASAVFEFGVR